MFEPGTIRCFFQQAIEQWPVFTFAGIFMAVGIFAIETYYTKSNAGLVLLFDFLIPGGAACALMVSSLVTSRYMIRWLCKYSTCTIDFGRKGNICLSSLLIISSCFYRSIFIASEGAAVCRGPPSLFNAPFAGRLVATLGEMSFVFQVGEYLENAASRLQTHRTPKFWSYAPVVLAELFSWTGVLSANAMYFCLEYTMWMWIAAVWAWDCAELLHKSTRWGDMSLHALLLTIGIGLFLFNLIFEIPFFLQNPGRVEVPASSSSQIQMAQVAHPTSPTLWSCHQDKWSPIWLKRLPFFFCYFFGCSWTSAALLIRFMGTCKNRKFAKTGALSSSLSQK